MLGGAYAHAGGSICPCWGEHMPMLGGAYAHAGVGICPIFSWTSHIFSMDLPHFFNGLVPLMIIFSKIT